MGQRADGNEVNPGFGDTADCFQGDITGGFQFCLPCSDTDGFRHLFGSHIVEQDPFDVDGKSLPDVFQGSGFHLDLQTASGSAGALYRFSYGTGIVNMIILYKDHVVQADTVVLPTTALDGQFVQGAQTGGGLARIEDDRLRPAYGV